MAGKRKRADNSVEGEGYEINGDGSAKSLERFQEWLVDVLEILKECVPLFHFQEAIPAIFFQQFLPTAECC